MWPLLTVLLFDSAVVRRVHVAPAETLAVTVVGSGPDVVMVPGLFGSAYGFRKLIPLLTSAGHRAIVIEPLGVGTSSRPRRADYSLDAQARRIARALDVLGVDGAVVVGHSVGGAIALRLGWMRPDLVSALVTIEGGPAESAAGPSLRRAVQFASFIRFVGGMGTVRRALRSGLVRASGNPSWITDDVIREYTAGAAADLGATLLAYMRMVEARESEPLAPHLAELRCPVRLLLGGARHDSGPRDEEVARLRAGVPQLEIETVAGAGHYLHEERPDAVARAIEDAVRSVVASGTGR